MKLGASLEAIVGRLFDLTDPEEALAGAMATVLEAAQRFGLKAIEMPMDAAFMYPAMFTEKALLRMRRAALDYGLQYTVHLPFWWGDLSSLNEFVRTASVHSALLGIERGRLLEPLAYVLHPWGSRLEEIAASDWPQAERQSFQERMLNRARRSLAELKAAAPEVLCLENTDVMPAEATVTLARQENLHLCLDVGHLVAAGGDPVAFFEEQRRRIQVIHLHDARPASAGGPKAHLPLGTGSVPLRALCTALEDRSWDGAIILELERREDLAQSIGWLRGLGLHG